MITILCYGDSNTWGWDPARMDRYDQDTRWPGVLQRILGNGYHIVEEGVPGRTTVWTDPIEGHMSGKEYFTSCLNSHRPIDLVIMMLGTNDLIYRISVSAYDIAEGVGAMIRTVKQSAAGPENGASQVLVLAPPTLGKNPDYGELIADGYEKSIQLSKQLKRVADLWDCAFLDTSQVIVYSDIDGVHLEASEHRKLGVTLVEIIKTMDL